MLRFLQFAVSKKVRRWLVVCGCVPLIGLALTNWFLGNALIAPANRTVGPPPDDLNVVTTAIASDSGSKIATWYIPADNSRATIVLLHPIRGDRRSMLTRAKLFHDAGYSVVMIDFQAHGESPGEHVTAGFLERYDVRAAVDYARKMNPKDRIGIVGWSMGGAAALLASPLDVDAVVLESVYPTIFEAIHDRVSKRMGSLSCVLSPVLLFDLQLRLGISPSDMRPIDHIAAVGCPVLVAAGNVDEDTTLAETQRLFDSAAQPKKLVIFQSAAHVDLLDYNRKQYTNDVLPFLANYLASSPVDRKTERQEK
jgi:uncharacterized protein